MTGIFNHLSLCIILFVIQVTGADFTISMDKVVIGSTGTLTMRCDVTENNVQTIYDIQIRRETTPGSNIFETLVLMEYGTAESETPSLADAINNNKDFVAGGTLDKTTPSNTYLTVSMNISKMVCSDARAYKCDLAYKQSSGSVITVEANGTFSAYVYPQVMLLEGKKNGFIVQGSSSDYLAEFAVGDELELSCTANIGSLPATTIRWRKTSEMGTTDEFIGYQPQAGSIDEGTAISDNQCGYTRTATITYNTTAADANRDNNLAFECYVSVSGNPYGTTYTTQNNPKFYAGVSGDAPATEGNEKHSDNKVALIVGVVSGILVAVVVVVAVVILRLKFITKEPQMTRLQTENSSVKKNQIQPLAQPDIGMAGQVSMPNAHYDPLQQAVYSPPAGTTLTTGTLN